jgi:hypothetical protein
VLVGEDSSGASWTTVTKMGVPSAAFSVPSSFEAVRAARMGRRSYFGEEVVIPPTVPVPPRSSRQGSRLEP